GDLARRGTDGLYEIVGRRSRFAKVFGLRVDLARVERGLAAAGVEATCVEWSGKLAVAVHDSSDPAEARPVAATLAGLPPRAVTAFVLSPVPRTSSGKTDYAAVVAAATRQAAVAEQAAGTGHEAATEQSAAAAVRSTASADPIEA